MPIDRLLRRIFQEKRVQQLAAKELYSSWVKNWDLALVRGSGIRLTISDDVEDKFIILSPDQDKLGLEYHHSANKLNQLQLWTLYGDLLGIDLSNILRHSLLEDEFPDEYAVENQRGEEYTIPNSLIERDIPISVAKIGYQYKGRYLGLQELFIYINVTYNDRSDARMQFVIDEGGTLKEDKLMLYYKTREVKELFSQRVEDYFNKYIHND